MIVLNPIMLRDMRQAMRSKLLVFFFLLFLTIEAIVAVVWTTTAATAMPGESIDAGRGMFGTLFSMMLVAALWFVPVFTSVRFALDRSSDHDDLCQLTALTPGAIVRGKLMSAAVITGVIFSASMPFLAITSWLGGLDAFSSALALVEAFGIVVLAVQATMFVLSSPTTRVRSMLLGLLVMVAMFIVSTQLVGLFFSHATEGLAIMFTSLRGVGTVLIAVAIYLTVFGLFHALCVGAVMPPVMNRAMVTRGYVTAAWIAWGLGAVVIGAYDGRLDATVGTWATVSMVIFICALPIVSSEDDMISMRVRIGLQRVRPFQILAALLSNGPASGIIWVSSLATATFIATMNVNNSDSVAAALFFYMLAATLTSMVLRRMLWPRSHRGLVWGGMALILCGTTLTPVLAAILLDLGNADVTGAWVAGNLVSLIHNGSRGRPAIEHVAAGAVWCGVGFLLNVPWLVRQMRNYVIIDEVRPCVTSTAGI